MVPQDFVCHLRVFSPNRTLDIVSRAQGHDRRRCRKGQEHESERVWFGLSKPTWHSPPCSRVANPGRFERRLGSSCEDLHPETGCCDFFVSRFTSGWKQRGLLRENPLTAAGARKSKLARVLTASSPATRGCCHSLTPSQFAAPVFEQHGLLRDLPARPGTHVWSSVAWSANDPGLAPSPSATRQPAGVPETRFLPLHLTYTAAKEFQIISVSPSIHPRLLSNEASEIPTGHGLLPANAPRDRSVPILYTRRRVENYA